MIINGRLWQRCNSLRRITLLSRSLRTRKCLEPLILHSLYSSSSPLPFTVCKKSLQQDTGSDREVASWQQRHNKPSVSVQKAGYCGFGNDGAEDKPHHGLTSERRRNKATPLLPKLPVPKVEDTLTKYLTVLSTVLSPHELHVTTQHVTEFMTPGGLGDSLQAYLLKRHSGTDNWASDWWVKSMYLDNRLPLPINFSPASVFPQQQYRSKEDYLRFASKYTAGLLDYKRILDSGTLPVEMANRTQPLCMEQKHRVMSSYRRPGIPSDQLLTGLGNQRPPFILVACGNQFYRVDVEQDGAGLSEGELYSQLCKVMTAAQHHTAGSPPVGILTTLDRSTWARVREQLAAVGENRNNLDIVENSLFLLCLDAARKPSSLSPPSSSSASSSLSSTTDEDEEENLLNLAHYALHGQGTEFNSCNRWFDEPLQILMAEDGSFGGICEHSVAEGEPFMAAVNHAFHYCSQAGCEEGEEEQESRCLRDPVWLMWTTTSEIDTYIDHAKDSMDRHIQRPDLCGRQFTGFGREFPKSQGISPDTFLQLAIQMAYYRLHGRLTMSYESATLRRFRHGREDNIRVNAPATLWWIQAMCGETKTSETEKITLFEAAIEWKEKYAREAVAGHGMDCHLIGLREAARDLGVLDSIPLFSDPAFQKAFQFPLSTSQVPNTNTFFSFFGPATLDGYGVGYKLFPHSMKLCVTSFRDCAETDSLMFTSCLESCLLDMRDFCLRKV